MICKICTNSENNKAYRVREMMFGFRDEFTYFECSKCGCLQIAEIPRDMDKYYPPNYLKPFHDRPSGNFIARFLRIRRDRYVLFNTGLIGNLLNKRYPRMYRADVFQAIAKECVSCGSRILEVGCGSGEVLYLLRDVGIRNLVGVDPYTSHEVLEDGIRILKTTFHELPDSQRFDLIVFNHSLEHIPDQLQTILKVSNMLTENGVCLIRVPLKTERIWNLYGVDWVQIDAPRHFYIHTMRSFNHLAGEAGLIVKDVTFDSTAFQFWGSEQYKRDIPLRAENSYAIKPETSIFTPDEIREFSMMAGELNKANQGDQASFRLMRNAKLSREMQLRCGRPLTI